MLKNVWGRFARFIETQRMAGELRSENDRLGRFLMLHGYDPKKGERPVDVVIRELKENARVFRIGIDRVRALNFTLSTERKQAALLVGGLKQITGALATINVPNGTTRKIRRIAAETLAAVDRQQLSPRVDTQCPAGDGVTGD